MGASMGKDRDKTWEIATLEGHQECINVLTVSEDGSLVITGSDDCTARLWSTEENKPFGVLEKGQKRPNQPPEAARYAGPPAPSSGRWGRS